MVNFLGMVYGIGFTNIKAFLTLLDHHCTANRPEKMSKKKITKRTKVKSGAEWCDTAAQAEQFWFVVL